MGRIDCLNQDLQDFRIGRMELSESGFTGLKDERIDCLNQDLQDFRISRMEQVFDHVNTLIFCMRILIVLCIRRTGTT